MAKRKVNKSQAVRDLLAANPKATTKEIVEAMGAKGLKISPNLVYLLKSKQKRKQRKQKRLQAVAASRAAGLSNPIEAVMQIKSLASHLGGIKNLKRLVDLLAE